MPKLYIGVRRKNHLTFGQPRIFLPFLHIAGNPTNRSATGKDINGHFEITSVHCCKRAVFWRLKLGFSGIRHILETRTPSWEGVSDGEMIRVHLPSLHTCSIPIIVGKSPSVPVGENSQSEGQNRGSFPFPVVYPIRSEIASPIIAI
jgi:hypothetical protein